MISLESLKRICLFLAAVFLFQSCSVYHNNNISLGQASVKKRDVKITDTLGVEHKFDWIQERENSYYGVTEAYSKTYKAYFGKDTIHLKKDLVGFLLDQDEIERIRSKNRPVSLLGNIAIIAAGTAALMVVIAGLVSTAINDTYNWD